MTMTRSFHIPFTLTGMQRNWPQILAPKRQILALLFDSLCKSGETLELLYQVAFHGQILLSGQYNLKQFKTTQVLGKQGTQSPDSRGKAVVLLISFSTRLVWMRATPVITAQCSKWFSPKTSNGPCFHTTFCLHSRGKDHFSFFPEAMKMHWKAYF